jgi:hypothetical protein
VECWTGSKERIEGALDGGFIFILLQFYKQVVQKPLGTRPYLGKLNAHAGFLRVLYRSRQAQTRSAGVNHHFNVTGRGKGLRHLNRTPGLAQVYQLAFPLSIGGNTVHLDLSIAVEAALFERIGGNRGF